MSTDGWRESARISGGDPNASTRVQAEIQLEERRDLELINVRGDLRAPEFRSAIEKAAQVVLPAAPNTVSRGATHDALWLGPDEWLLQSLEPCEHVLESSLRHALRGRFSAVVDVSSGYVVLVVSGMRACEILQKGCPLDLHPRVFTADQCAQSHFYKTGILLRRSGESGFELLIRRSYAGYARRLLLDAAPEFPETGRE